MAGKRWLTDLEVSEIRVLTEKRANILRRIKEIAKERKDLRAQAMELRDEDIAKDYGVHRCTVSLISCGKVYKTRDI